MHHMMKTFVYFNSSVPVDCEPLQLPEEEWDSLPLGVGADAMGADGAAGRCSTADVSQAEALVSGDACTEAQKERQVG